MSDDLLPVETLDRLSHQEGVDVRPILVRVLTDLFVQKHHHAPQEVARYEELALQLLEVVDVGTRTAVARKLADEPRAPMRVIERLLGDDFSVSAPILARFPNVPRQVLLTLALDGGAVEASAVAMRADIDGDMVRILAHHPDGLVLETLVSNPAARPTQGTLVSLVGRAAGDAALAAAILRRDDFDPAAVAGLYLHAGPEKRTAIREALANRPSRFAAARPLRSPDAVDAALVEAAAEAGRGHRIFLALGEALGLKPADATALACEPSGEPFAMMLRAAGLDQNRIARALLVGHPEVAHSVTRFFELIDSVEATPRSVAADLVAALAGEDVRPSVPARHEPLFDPSGVKERPGAARSASGARRPIVRPAESARQRG